MRENLKLELESVLQESIQGELRPGRIKTLSGKEYFLKYGNSSLTYLCGANGLKELAKAKAIHIVEVIAVGESYILTEYITGKSTSDTFYQTFGKAFARLHRYQGKSFGFYEDNFIGANPQLNIPEGEETTNWATFFFQKRLLYQFRLAEHNGYVSSSMRNGFKRLENNVEGILHSSIEPPTLLHGDLWAGNFLCDEQGEPVLIDPAVYYGHREADLAMTCIFGGFPTVFYEAYQDEYPLPDGWENREYIYKLYHVLNHLNIFGMSYLPETQYLLSR